MKPESLNIWDRIFNRYRKEIIERGSETWTQRYGNFGVITDKFNFARQFVVYKVIDRLTGSETIEKEYLN